MVILDELIKKSMSFGAPGTIVIIAMRLSGMQER